MALQAVKEDATSLRRYKSEQLLLPTSEYGIHRGSRRAPRKRPEGQARSGPPARSSPHPPPPRAQGQAQGQGQAQAQAQGQGQAQAQGQGQAISPIAPLTSNKVFNLVYGVGQRQQKAPTPAPAPNLLVMPAVDPMAETPPLMSLPHPHDTEEIPILNLNLDANGNATMNVSVDVNVNDPPARRTKLRRVHSLSLSEFDDGDTHAVDFVNPFVDESAVYNFKYETTYGTSSVPDQDQNTMGVDNTNEKPR
eukprot:jgi/Psemu1/207613/e_gw1.441.16.1